MKKYIRLFNVSLQKQLEVRSDFFFERFRSLSIMLSLYFLWSALLDQRDGILGYSRDQLLTYVLVMTLLRAWVLSCVTDRIPVEIAKGNLSDILLRPIPHQTYWMTQDAANKTLNLCSASMELALFAWLVRAPFVVPSSALQSLGFLLSVVGGMILYFQMSYLLGVMGFWTSQSWGPRFCFEVVLEFCAGAYFPIDLLPASVQKFLSLLPFPYLVFYPVSIYLGRVEGTAIFLCLLTQGIWIGILSFLTKLLWQAGLKQYAAEGR